MNRIGKTRHMITRMALLAAMILSLGGCKQHTIIPDDELALIFHDAFLANSLLNKNNAKKDSLLIYEPIFERYGYTTEDVRYTIGNFSKRKSARLGDVVEESIRLLEAEGLRLNKAVAALDTVNNVALRHSRRTIYRDSLRRATRLKDTANLRITLDSLRPGTYTIKTRYEVDSLDENRSLRVQLWMEREDSSRVGQYTVQLRRRSEEKFERTVTADSSIRRLVVNFWNPLRGQAKRPHITLRETCVEFQLPQEEAVDSLYEQQLNIRIFANDFLRTIEADSLALPADTTRLAAKPAR